MGRPTITEDAKWLLKTLKEQGGSCGNYNLKRQLGWKDERFWRTHAIVLNEGLITRGRGYGGTSTIVDDVDTQQSVPVTEAVTSTLGAEVAATYAKESELYPLAKAVIEDAWARERSYNHHVVEVTAQPRKVQTGGTWTRPDVSLLADRSFPYFPGRFFDIVTFEIKTAEATDVRGVFEALSHAQFATFAYVIFHTEQKDFKDFPNSDRVVSTAAAHGIGLIAASDITKYEKWIEVVTPRRNIPDPEQANQFIGASFSEGAREKIAKWFR